jgi:hypothetical protein
VNSENWELLLAKHRTVLSFGGRIHWKAGNVKAGTTIELLWHFPLPRADAKALSSLRAVIALKNPINLKDELENLDINF